MPRELLVPRPFEVTLSPYDEPPLKAGEVRARAVMSALSHGTELSLYRGTAPFHERAFDPESRLFRPAEAAQSYPVRLGYEWVGRVTEVAPDVSAFITHRFPFTRAADAYRLVDQHPAEVLKVVLEY